MVRDDNTLYIGTTVDVVFKCGISRLLHIKSTGPSIFWAIDKSTDKLECYNIADIDYCREPIEHEQSKNTS